MSTNLDHPPCPKCGAPLPIPDAVVCPRCDAILRPDGGLDDKGIERQKRLCWMVGGGTALVMFGFFASGNLGGRQMLVALIPVAIYGVAYSVARRRFHRPLPLLFASLAWWLGLCALAVGIFFVGCLVVISRGGFGG